ncbi:uncharacterized protein LOC119982337 isoform X2 [Tripterygium wilfordii]|uniref:uncharacterized protein LOC119982337 isoform X2 n=1 Tax=Tripterygium wilfordii TaxID=458696 RepID=UPI0018F7FE09|nr:uncharacterized protein LOC119982337 isoform X2 [Tripterygium wilfordii]
MKMNDIVGYRFNPTDIEIIDHYLRLKLLGDVHRVRAISEVNVFKHEPWDLSGLSAIQSDSMWHFFCRKDFKYASGERVNRTTDAGYWKKTGNDRKIRKGITKQVIGAKKNLVFYTGRSPNGKKTNWVMHEFHPTFVPSGERTFVLCRLEKKEGEENDGTPGVGHEPSSDAPAGSRDHVGDNTVAAPEVIGNTSLQTLVTENGECVVDDTVFSPEVIRNASQRTLPTENGNCVLENKVSSPEGNNSIEMAIKYLASVPLELLDTILPPASEFQVQQEAVAANNIQAENCFANNREGALFNSFVNIEADDDSDLFLRGLEYVNHGEIETQVDPFVTGDDSIIDHRTNGALSGGGRSIDQSTKPFSSIGDGYRSIDQRTEPFTSCRGGFRSIDQRTNPSDEFRGDWCMIDQRTQDSPVTEIIDQHRSRASVSTYEKPLAPPLCSTSLPIRLPGCTVFSDEILEIKALTICESSDGSQDSPKSLSDAAASPATEKSVPRELKSSRDSDINVFPLVENSNDSQHSAISRVSATASQAAKGSVHMQQKSYAIPRFVAASSPATKKGSPATEKRVDTEQSYSRRINDLPLVKSCSYDSLDSSRSLFVAAASPATKKRVSVVQKSSHGINVLPMIKSADGSGGSQRTFVAAASSPAKKSVYMQQKSSPKSTSKYTKKGSTTASPARKSVYTQRKSSSRTWSEDTTEGSSSSSSDSMISLLRELKGKSVYMQQKSSPKSTSKDNTKKGSTTASPAKKSLYTQRKSSLETWSQDTTKEAKESSSDGDETWSEDATEESSSSSSDSMTSILRGLEGVKLA